MEHVRRSTMNDFEHMCFLLKYNNPLLDTVQLDAESYPIGYGRALGKAILDNTIVAAIGLNVRKLIRFGEEAEHATTETSSSASPLLRYLTNSQTLRKVTLNDGERHYLIDRLSGLLVRAVARNPNVFEFYCNVWLPPTSLAHLMQTTVSITRLELAVRDFYVDDSDVDTCQMVTAAFEANRTLEVIVLDWIKNSTELVNAVLAGLVNHPFLQAIGISSRTGNMPLLRTLPSLLQSAHSKIGHVTLARHLFDGTTWTELCESLRSPSRTRVLETLSLEGCAFDQSATQCFIASLQPDHGHHPTVRELRFKLDQDSSTFAQIPFGRFMTELAVASPPGIECLTVINGPRCPMDLMVLYERLEQRKMVVDMKLNCLHLRGHFCQDGLARCLPNQTNLRELIIDSFLPCENKLKFLDGLQRNGSLYCISLTESPPLFLSQRELNLARAYCHRNRNAPALLASRDATGGPIHGWLFPLVFATTQPAARTAPNTMLIGLLADVDCILGPVLRPKRRTRDY
jgi:hypothetical protein